MSKVLFLVSPTLNSFVDPRKGTTGNKIDCATKHFTNGMRSNIELGALAGVTAFAGKMALRKTDLAAQLANMGMFKKVATMIKAAPTSVKIVASALGMLSLIHRSYKTGIIEQKYIDRAQFVDNTFKPERSNAAPVK